MVSEGDVVIYADDNGIELTGEVINNKVTVRREVDGKEFFAYPPADEVRLADDTRIVLRPPQPTDEIATYSDGHFGRNINLDRTFALVEALADELGYELVSEGELTDLRKLEAAQD
jgi:hypothetical protein